MKWRFRRASGGKRLEFLEADFAETTDVLPNPLRGWYSIYTFAAEEEPDLRELSWCLKEDETLALLLIDIGSFRNRDLDGAAIDRIRSILEFFCQNQKGIILRVVYDHEGKGMEREPLLFSQVLRHAEQVGALLEGFPGVVFVYQGLLVGSWGEMHTSRFLSGGQLRRIAAALSAHRGEGTFLAVRRPCYWRLLHDFGLGAMGLFDDGILGSFSHLGTFGVQTRDEAGEYGAWSREEELAFEEELCRRVPNGGEAVYGEGYLNEISKGQVLETLDRMHITYLNSQYDSRLLDCWKRSCYEGRGIWKGKSLYDYIGAHLGYRFRVRHASAEPLREEGGEKRFRMCIEVENVGFAVLYQEAELWLEWHDDGGNQEQELFDCDMRRWESGGVQQVSCVAENVEGELFLRAWLKRNRQPIWFANQSDEEGRVYLGSFSG